MKNIYLIFTSTILFFLLTFCTPGETFKSPSVKNGLIPPQINQSQISEGSFLKRHQETLKRGKQSQIPDSEDSIDHPRHRAALKKAVENTASQYGMTQWRFFAYGPFHHLIKWEIGAKSQFLQGQKMSYCQVYYDTGEVLTCVGISYHVNYNWFLEVLSEHFGQSKCVYVTEKKDLFCTDEAGKSRYLKKHREYYRDIMEKLVARPGMSRRISDFFWDNYTKRYFTECSFKAAMLLSDTAILTGSHRAVELLQKSHGLTVDRIWGPQSRKACSKDNFMPKSYLHAEIQKFKTYRLWPKYGKGWSKRIQNKEVYAEKAEAKIKKNTDKKKFRYELKD